METTKTQHIEKLASWKFSFKNIGCITNGEIDAKPLTILCGKNNTGKTWVMYGLYGFLNIGVSNLVLPQTQSMSKELIEKGNLEFNVIDWIKENFAAIKKDFNKNAAKMLSDVFNTNDKDIFSHSSFDWLIEENELIDHVYSKELTVSLVVGTGKKEIVLISKGPGSSIIQMTLLDTSFPRLENFINMALSQLLKIEHDSNPSFLIPAERNGLHLFFNELSSRRTALLHHASKEQFDLSSLLNDVLKSKYSAPIANYIDWLNEIRTNRKNKNSDFHHAAEELKKVISGKYTVDPEGQIYFSTYKRGASASKKIELHLSSSTVKSLFGLWFYLEHQAKLGDILMIDEPELNLHPKNQRVIARFIAKLVNAGLRVIVSTHSDYFVKEINSLMMLHNANSTQIENRNAIMKKQGISLDSMLNPNDVAAYVFDNSSVKEMVKSAEGINANTFDEVINSINEDNDEIYYSLIDIDSSEDEKDE
ncbi:AAA family ATPase [Enterobacter asburiae]|uniref:AAA family ATPase n=1 Tax=Scandinavium sp. UTDF21-P1B TaxID=3446379 RepID=UPI003483AA5C